MGPRITMSPRTKRSGRVMVPWASSMNVSHVGTEASVTPQVGGMNCSSCSAAVEAALKRHPGVLRAHVALTTQEARVEYGPLLASEVKHLPVVFGSSACACSHRMLGQQRHRLGPLPGSHRCQSTGIAYQHDCRHTARPWTGTNHLRFRAGMPDSVIEHRFRPVGSVLQAERSCCLGNREPTVARLEVSAAHARRTSWSRRWRMLASMAACWDAVGMLGPPPSAWRA